MRHVFFLGAGFSAAYGLPVMNEFFSFARQSENINQQEKAFIGEVQRFAHMGVRLISIPYNNMEDILSFLEMAEHCNLVPDRLENASLHGERKIPPSDLLKRIIAKVYGPLPTTALRRFGEFHSAGKSAALFDIHLGASAEERWTIITTNYDLCVEMQLLAGRQHVRLPGKWGGPGLGIRGAGATTNDCIYDNDSPITLLRLHGAVNWRPCAQVEGDGTPKFDFVVDAHVDPNDRIPWAAKQELYSNDLGARLLVPPTVLKHQVGGPFAEQWSEAAKALAEAQRITFVGYSFPESDAYMRYFLGASLADNVGLEGITIIDPNANAISTRLKSGGLYGPHFVSLLKPINRPWQNQG